MNSDSALLAAYLAFKKTVVDKTNIIDPRDIEDDEFLMTAKIDGHHQQK
ncbi:hypothetical protein [Gelidibacter pelagius]|uniref:Uncharacterized protein n=1 Tax=Gelidibacter pelagius TaxID=2819985 RepID=A0ABS3SM56_9FLAO|nr:hypothetical protein [Gelidibacter pelagius]MBO3096790.1 hypothetical protein [Gelidibacter pelagius]